LVVAGRLLIDSALARKKLGGDSTIVKPEGERSTKRKRARARTDLIREVNLAGS
jgi:1-acyl-sn-glycerol-3-phosphate acyltransferase